MTFHFALLPSLPILGFFDTLTDLAFVIKILVFAYLMYWLYVVFREQQLVMGIATLIAAYFLFFHAISITVFVLLFLVFIVMSGHFQFIIDMGILPIMQMFGFHEAGHGDEVKIQDIQRKLMQGETLSMDEVERFKEHEHRQSAYQERAEKLLSSGGAQRPQ